MRRLVAALVVAALAFVLAGCGGGGSETSEAASTEGASQGGAAAPGAPPAPPAAEGGGTDMSPLESEPGAREPFPDMAGNTPEEISQRLQDGRPMVLFFYDAAQPNTDDLRAEVDAVLKEYRGLIDMLTYDVASGLSDKQRSLDPTAAEQLSIMESTLGVDHTPYVILIDKRGEITWRLRGFADRGLIEREVLRATQ